MFIQSTVSSPSAAGTVLCMYVLCTSIQVYSWVMGRSSQSYLDLSLIWNRIDAVLALALTMISSSRRLRRLKECPLLFLNLLTCVMLAATEPKAHLGAAYQRRTDKGSTKSSNQPKNDHQCSKSTTRRKLRQKGLTNFCSLRMALLVLLLVVGSIFLVYRLSTNSTGEGIDVDTPRSSDIKREP
jgi:hypothetical protein